MLRKNNLNTIYPPYGSAYAVRSGMKFLKHCSNQQQIVTYCYPNNAAPGGARIPQTLVA